MIHAFVVAFAIFVNPTTGDEQLVRQPVVSPIECAKLLNSNRTIDTPNGKYYQVKSECKGVYVESGHVLSWDGDGNQTVGHQGAKHGRN